MFMTLVLITTVLLATLSLDRCGSCAIAGRCLKEGVDFRFLPVRRRPRQVPCRRREAAASCGTRQDQTRSKNNGSCLRPVVVSCSRSTSQIATIPSSIHDDSDRVLGRFWSY